MDRERMMEEVKGVYASLAEHESQQHFAKTTDSETPKGYYDKLLTMVLHEISAGTFDNFQSGKAIMDAVAKDKQRWLSEWKVSKWVN